MEARISRRAGRFYDVAAPRSITSTEIPANDATTFAKMADRIAHLEEQLHLVERRLDTPLVPSTEQIVTERVHETVPALVDEHVGVLLRRYHDIEGRVHKTETRLDRSHRELVLSIRTLESRLSSRAVELTYLMSGVMIGAFAMLIIFLTAR